MDKKRAVEFNAIQADALWAYRFVRGCERNPGPLPVTASLSTFSYLSLFRHEGLKYLRKVHPDFVKLLPQPTNDELERSRNAIKLFDVHEHVDGVIDHFMDDICAVHTQHFERLAASPINPHPVDLGLTYYGDRIIYTTHGATFALGVSHHILLGPDGSQYVKEASIEYGKHFGPFRDQAQPSGTSFVDKLDAVQVTMEDCRADHFYGSHFNGKDTPGINALLCVFLTSLNYLDSMVRLDDLPESRHTILKMQFITLYHITSSLKKLRSKHAAELSQQSLDHTSQVIDDNALKTIIDGPARMLRNTFMHYGLHPDVQDSDLNPYLPGFGLIEKYLPGYDYASLSTAATGQVERMAKIFNEWV